MSVILGVIGIASIIVAIVLTYAKGGNASLEYSQKYQSHNYNRHDRK